MLLKPTSLFIYIALCNVFVLCNENIGPSIVVNPKDTIAIPGKNVSLFCITNGLPKPTVVWEKDDAILTGKHYSISSNGALHISGAIEARDKGTYRCRSTNVIGTIVSLQAKLGFPFLDPFAEPFSNMQARNGDRLVLKCQIPDAAPLNSRSVRWSKKDFRYADLLPPLETSPYYTVGNDGDLYFSYVTSADTGSYVCVVGNTILGRSEERTVKLKVGLSQENIYEVRSPGVFSAFSEPKFAVEGKAFVLECIGYGRPVPHISLKKSGGTTELGKTTTNKRTYVIRDFSAKDAGTYVCIVRNDYGDSSEVTTTVTMLVKAQWTSRPKDASVDVNASLTWKCKAKGVPPIKYTWLHNGVNMKQADGSPNYVIKDGTLTFSKLQVSQRGMYQCHASNSVRSLITAAELNVKAAPPSFDKGGIAPDEITNAVTTGTAVITCQPAGSPRPKVTWLKGSTAIGESSDKFSVSDDGTLRIFKVKKNDRGTYTCIGRNPFGVIKKSTYLMIKEGIVIVNFPRTANAIVGHNLSLTCEVELETKSVVSFEWTQNLRQFSERNIIITNSLRKSVLFIKELTLKNSAIYSCKAIADSLTGAGRSHDYADIRIKVKGPPEAPISITVSDVKKHHVNITWATSAHTNNNNSPVKRVIVEYKTLYEPGIWYSSRHVLLKGENKAEVKISPWAFYTFRIILVNAIGQSQPSPLSALIQSPAAAPDKAPSNITGLGPSPTELTISWQGLKPIEHNGPGLHYAVFYRRVKDSSPMTRVQVNLKKKLEYTVKNTKFYEQFEFQVQAINALGAGPRSAMVYGYSGEKSPIGEPQDLRVQILNSRSARATWTGIKKDRSASRGKLLGYKVYYWSTQHGMRPSDAHYEPTGDTVTMVGLESFTTYFFQVVAYNSKGDGPGSNVVGPLSTPESVPEAPFSVDIHVTKPEVTLKWKPPLKKNGIMVGYQVTVRKLPVGQINIIDVGNQRLEQEFEALDLNGKYQFALLARNRVGFGPPLVVNIDLNKVPKNAPEDIFITVDKKRKTANVKWSKVEGMIDGYRVSYWNTQDGTEKSTKFQEVDKNSGRSVTVANLEKLTYKFQVRTYQEFGDNLVLGPESKIQTVTMSTDKSMPTSRSDSWILRGVTSYLILSAILAMLHVML
ncbi:contactin-6-like [Dendronephthya gigantea]|uniref:contactin-6-like n=1 Tax=Dendronephthya gigantea TaxID=151771 RepID=UPI00106ADD24|nr:contactin-6-like [Dendronephthya gigantea]XP_028408043.1 contactin-6-like [Dendronephthya gigantea]XP_028408044.1 contactin-6-like [Dendronephthya gigantea]